MVSFAIDTFADVTISEIGWGVIEVIVLNIFPPTTDFSLKGPFSITSVIASPL